MSVPRLAGRRVLVTGATGFLGRHLRPALAAEGAEVHGIRTSGKGMGAGVARWHTADVRDAGALRDAVAAARPDLVIHLAAYGASADQRDEARMRAVNVGGTRALLECLDPSVRVVMAGTCAEYGHVDGAAVEAMPCRPVSRYATTKHEAVRLVVDEARRTGRAAVVLRPYGPYGPDDHPTRVIPSVVLGLLRGETVAVTEGRQRRDFSYVSDHVEALIRASVTDGLAPGAIYNVGSGVAVTLRETLERVAEAVGGAGRLDFGARPYRDDEIREMVPDVSAAARDLGFRAAVPFADGLARTVAWYRRHVVEAPAR